MTDTFTTGEPNLAAFMMAKGAKYIEMIRDGTGHCEFVFEDEALCANLKREYINGAEAPAEELFQKKERLVTEMKTNYKNGNTYGNYR